MPRQLSVPHRRLKCQEQTQKILDETLLHELKGGIFRDVGGFFEKYLEGAIPMWLHWWDPGRRFLFNPSSIAKFRDVVSPLRFLFNTNESSRTFSSMSSSLFSVGPEFTPDASHLLDTNLDEIFYLSQNSSQLQSGHHSSAMCLTLVSLVVFQLLAAPVRAPFKGNVFDIGVPGRLPCPTNPPLNFNGC